MSEKAKQRPFFQGNDWYTSRWVAAHAYDSLDKLQDLCLCRMNSPPQDRGEETQELIEGIASLTDDLQAEIESATADILGQNEATPMPLQWKAFEIELYLKEIRRTLHEGVPETSDFFEELYSSFTKAKEALKALDQGIIQAAP